MKQLLIMLFVAIAMTAQAQMFEAPKRAKTEWKDSTTTYTYKTVKGDVCKVYKTRRGAFYYYAKNRKGILTRYYCPREIQEKMGRKYDK